MHHAGVHSSGLVTTVKLAVQGRHSMLLFKASTARWHALCITLHLHRAIVGILTFYRLLCRQQFHLKAAAIVTRCHARRVWRSARDPSCRCLDQLLVVRRMRAPFDSCSMQGFGLCKSKFAALLSRKVKINHCAEDVELQRILWHTLQHNAGLH